MNKRKYDTPETAKSVIAKHLEKGDVFVAFKLASGAGKAFLDEAKKNALPYVATNWQTEDEALALAIGRAIQATDPDIIYVALAGSAMLRAAEQLGLCSGAARFFGFSATAGAAVVGCSVGTGSSDWGGAAVVAAVVDVVVVVAKWRWRDIDIEQGVR